MAESVKPALGIERWDVGRREYYAGGSNGCADPSRAHDSHPHRSRRLISRARHYWRSWPQAGGLCSARRNPSADLGRLPQCGQHMFLNAGPAQHLRRPGAAGDVEKESARSVRHIDGPLAGSERRMGRIILLDGRKSSRKRVCSENGIRRSFANFPMLLCTLACTMTHKSFRSSLGAGPRRLARYLDGPICTNDWRAQWRITASGWAGEIQARQICSRRIPSALGRDRSADRCDCAGLHLGGSHHCSCLPARRDMAFFQTMAPQTLICELLVTPSD